MAKKKKIKHVEAAEILGKETADERDEQTALTQDDDEVILLPGPDGEAGEGNDDALLPEKISVDPELKAISPMDPLRRYIEEVARHPLLEPGEEYRLTREFQKKNDPGLFKRLVSANLRLVVKIAFEYRSLYANILDLIQEGNMGLMKAVSKFDPAKGARLGYYASWWIRSYILKYLLDNFSMVRIGTTQAQKKLFYHLMKEKRKLEALGQIPAPKLLAEKLDVREQDVIEMQTRLGNQGSELTLDTPVSNPSGKGTDQKVLLLDLFSSGAPGVDEGLAEQELLDILKNAIPKFRSALGPKELKILDERLLSENPKTLQEVADEYSLTRERVRQIEAKIIEKLRDYLKPKLAGSLKDEP